MQNKILIIEDERVLAHALDLELKKQGCEIKLAFNGEEGLFVLENEEFDLIVCDILMAKVDGYKVLEELKKRKNKTPIIVLSNLSQEEDVNKALQLGAKAFIIKSNITISDLVTDLKNNLNR